MPRMKPTAPAEMKEWNRVARVAAEMRTSKLQKSQLRILAELVGSYQTPVGPSHKEDTARLETMIRQALLNDDANFFRKLYLVMTDDEYCGAGPDTAESLAIEAWLEGAHTWGAIQSQVNQGWKRITGRKGKAKKAVSDSEWRRVKKVLVG
jgi:hypothetical protein